MVEQASFVSRELGISREEQDEWALRSHQRAIKAQDEGFFEGEIVPVGEVVGDEGPRRDTSIEALAKLKPVFDPEGTTTAGNAPGVNDGASCVVVCSEEDFRWALQTIDKLQLWGKVPVLFSPAHGQVEPQALAKWVLESGRPARLQLQLHKLIWGAEARGV